MFASQRLEFKSKKINRLLKVFAGQETVVKEVTRILEKIEDFTAFEINREISAYVYEYFRKDNRFTSPQIYAYFKFLLCGKECKQYFGELAEFIGKEETVRRIRENSKILNKMILAARRAYIEQLE